MDYQPISLTLQLELIDLATKQLKSAARYDSDRKYEWANNVRKKAVKTLNRLAAMIEGDNKNALHAALDRVADMYADELIAGRGGVPYPTGLLFMEKKKKPIFDTEPRPVIRNPGIEILIASGVERMLQEAKTRSPEQKISAIIANNYNATRSNRHDRNLCAYPASILLGGDGKDFLRHRQ